MNAPRRRRHDPNAMAEHENSIWDVYNNVADVEDDELIKDWNDSLNFLLVFAAIFAAVLTALIVESMKLLQEDPQTMTTAILLHISAQLANSTTPPFGADNFEIPRYAIIVNALLFSSLCCSLVAALAAVLALQWVNEYDARIDTVDARKRALIRHFRFLGVETWKMGEIIAVLPLLLHASVFLFFAGIIQWLNHLHEMVFYICVGGATAALTFYTVTVLLASFFGNSPFRSPMARASRYIIYGSAWKAAIILLKVLQSATNPERFWFRPFSTLQEHLIIIMPQFHKLRKTKVLEENQAHQKDLEETLMKWTIYHVELANQSTHRLVQILKHADLLFEDRRLRVSWKDVVNQVSDTYLDKAISQELLVEDLATIRILVKNWTSRYFQKGRYEYMQMVNTRDWDQWDSMLQLIGPLWISEKPTESLLDTFVSMIEARCSKNNQYAVAQLVEATLSCNQTKTPQQRQIRSYALDSMSLYLCDRPQNEAHRQVVDRLVEMITIRPSRLQAPIKQDISIPLALSALYSVAFGSTGRNRQYWASKHPLHPAARFGDYLGTVQKFHSAITIRIAAACLQETDIELVEVHLQHLCRFMAYTPCAVDIDKTASKCIEILELLPHSFEIDEPSTRENNLTALPSVIWLQRIKYIPHIHHYLEVLLSCRRRFRTIKPVWRTWRYKDETWPIWPAPYEYQRWLDQFRRNRRLLHVIKAFDGLIDDTCSTAQHLVMVQLVIDDLMDEEATGYEGYYTEDRKLMLARVRDPALRLVGARAAGIPYSGTIPHLEDMEWSSDPWIEAVKFWCERYDSGDLSADEAVLHAALLQSNTTLHAVVVDSSSQNVLLQDQLRTVLESKLGDQDNVEAALLAHAAVRTASWFSEYLEQTKVLDRLLKLMNPLRAYNLRVLPLLSDWIPRINILNQLIIVVGAVHETLERSTSHPTQDDVDSISTTFEHLLRVPPSWLQPAIRTNTHEHGWIHMSEQLSSIVRTLREPENTARAVIRWNPKSEILSEDKDDDAITSTEMEDSDEDMSETTHRGEDRPRRVLAGWLRGLFRHRKKEIKEENSSLSEETNSSEASDDNDTSSSDRSSTSSSSSGSGSSSSSDSSRDSYREDAEDARRRFMEGKGGGAWLYSCSAAFDI